MDDFAAAPEAVPANGDAGAEKLHSSYQSLYRNMEVTFEKLGLSEYHAAVGEAYNPSTMDRVSGERTDAPPPPHFCSCGAIAARQKEGAVSAPRAVDWVGGVVLLPLAQAPMRRPSSPKTPTRRRVP